MCLPDYVIVMSQIKFLLVFTRVVHNSDAGDKVHDLLGGRVVQVVAALVSPVAVNPLESQMTVRSCSVSHVRTCFALKRCFFIHRRTEPSHSAPFIRSVRCLRSFVRPKTNQSTTYFNSSEVHNFRLFA